MKFNAQRRFERGALKNEDNFLSTLNNFMETTWLALSGRLSFRDNMLGTVVENVEFTSATAKVINPLGGRANKFFVSGVLVVDAGGKTVTGFKWERRTDGDISVTLTFSEGGSAKCRLHIHLE